MDLPDFLRRWFGAERLLRSLNVAAVGVAVGRSTNEALLDLHSQAVADQSLNLPERLREIGAAHGYMIIKEFDLNPLDRS